MTEFSDRPLYMGTITGLRAFEVDRLGRLIPPTRNDKPFGPGENVAECVSAELDVLTRALRRRLGSSPYSYTYPQGVLTSRPVQPEPKDPPPHQVAGLKCSCGYYAYTDGSNTYASASTVSAVIEGYGTVTVGERGFRAEKARLVALAISRDPGWWVTSKHRVPPLALLGAAIGLLGSIVGLLMTMAGHSDAGAVVGGIGTGLLLISAVIFGAIHTLIEESGPRRRRETTALVRRNYAGVPIYHSERAMLRAHPLPKAPNPTPDDDDFWTRSA